MSVVVAFKYKDGVIVGADKRVSRGFRLRDDLISKIYNTKFTNHAIGVVGMVRILNLLSIKDELMNYEDILNGEEVNYPYMCASIVPNLIKYLSNNNAIANEDGVLTTDSSILYATSEKIFTVESDFAVMEYPKWAAIGCGEEMVSGLMSNMTDEFLEEMDEEDAIGLMQCCISNACARDSAVSEDYEYILIKKEPELIFKRRKLSAHKYVAAKEEQEVENNEEISTCGNDQSNQSDSECGQD